jgi:hypothetical protein
VPQHQKILSKLVRGLASDAKHLLSFQSKVAQQGVTTVVKAAAVNREKWNGVG